MSLKRQWYVMDYFKFFFCLCIIGIHAELFKGYGELHYWIEKGIFRVGVPFFIVASGFLLGKKIFPGGVMIRKEDVKMTLIAFSKRLLIMLINSLC